jgi:putative SOS response-associated peptidase YedK
MCGRFVSVSDPDQLGRLFAVDDLDVGGLAPNPNVAPTEPVLAVLERHSRRALGTLRWGLVPSWATDRRAASRMINARAETVTDRPAFRDAFRRRRCLLPADGYYEWWREEDGSRTPHLLRHPEGGVLAFAGLWDVWRDPASGGEPVGTCAILTTEADPAISWLHDRMPVILPPELWGDWLDRDGRDPAALSHLLAAAPTPSLTCTAVDAAVNDARNKDLTLPAARS